MEWVYTYVPRKEWNIRDPESYRATYKNRECLLEVERDLPVPSQASQTAFTLRIYDYGSEKFIGLRGILGKRIKNNLLFLTGQYGNNSFQNEIFPEQEKIDTFVREYHDLLSSQRDLARYFAAFLNDGDFK